MKLRTYLLRACLAGVLHARCRAPLHAQGGAPMITDDARTLAAGHWEIDVAVATTRLDRGARGSQAPLCEVNYGLTDRVQLSYDLPWLVVQEPGASSRAGLGPSTCGVKWRWHDGGDAGLACATHPQVEFNNPGSSRARGLVDAGTSFQLPLEVDGRLGPLGWSAEVGRVFNTRAADEWSYGLAAGREVRPGWELAAEVHGARRFDHNDDELIANFGLRVKLTARQSLLLAAGRGIGRVGGREATFVGYLGLQWNL